MTAPRLAPLGTPRREAPWARACLAACALVTGGLSVAAPSLVASQEPADTLSADTLSGDTLPADPDSVEAQYELEGITVTATRPVIRGGGASAVELHMDSLSQTAPSPTLSEVLRRMPLIRIRQNSRGQVQPSLRGMEERQIAVLLDGVPITIGWDNRTDLSVVPMTGATQINMVRGLSSVLAGPNAVGGLLEIEVSQQAPPEELSRIGSFRIAGEQTGAVSLSGELGHLWRPDPGEGSLWVRYGGGFRKSPGRARSSELDRGADSDRDGLLLNTESTFANGFVSARWQAAPDRPWISFSSTGMFSDRQILPELHLLGGENPTPRFWRIPEHWRSVTSISTGTGWRETPLGEGDLELAVGVDLQHIQINSFASEAFAARDGVELGDDRTITARLVGDHTLGSGVIRASGTFADTWHEEDLSDRGPREFQQRLWSVGTEIEQPLDPGDRLEGFFQEPRITVGFSGDGATMPQTGGQPSQPGLKGWGGRASAEVTLGRDVGKLHGGASRKIRFPALRELFSGALGKFEPNPNLDPITLKVLELGTTWYGIPGLEVQGILFTQRLEGSIIRAVLPDGKLQRQNRGETRAKGFELVTNWRTGPLGFRSDLTVQDVELRGGEEEERPEYQPEVVFNFFADLDLPRDFRLRSGIEYLSEQFGANARTGTFDRVDPTVYLEAGVSRRFEAVGHMPPFRASIFVENLTDEAIFDQLGLPRAGRTIRFELAVD